MPPKLKKSPEKEALTEKIKDEIYTLLEEHGFEHTDRFRTPGFYSGMKKNGVEINAAFFPNKSKGAVLRVDVSVPINTSGLSLTSHKKNKSTAALNENNNFQTGYGGPNKIFAHAEVQIKTSEEVRKKLGGVLKLCAMAEELVEKNPDRLLDYYVQQPEKSDK